MARDGALVPALGHGITTDIVLVSQQQQPTISLLDPHAVEFMMICLCRDRGFFEEAKHLVQSHYFSAEESVLSHAWRAISQSYERYGGCNYAVMAHLFHASLSSVEHTFTPVQITTMLQPGEQGLIWSLTNTPIDQIGLRYGRDVMQRFLYERTVVRPLQQVMRHQAAGYPATLDGFIDRVQKQSARLQSMSEIPSVDVAPDLNTLTEPAHVFAATGLELVDKPLGGQRRGDCNGIIGVTGGGKTTLAVYLATQTAHTAWTEAGQARTTPELVFYVTIEESAKKIRPRIWSSAFELPKEIVEKMKSGAELTTQATLKDYERLLPQTRVEGVAPIFASESERYAAGRIWLKTSFELLDLSGSDNFPAAGLGYVPEIVSYIDRVTQQKQQGVRSIFIDYAGLLCSRYLEASGHAIDDRYMRPLLRGLGDTCRRQLSERFNCTTWLMHQVRGDAGNYSPTRPMTHHDAAECKDLATNMAVCGCLGTADRVSGCRLLNWSKIRYKAGERVPPAIVKIDETFAKMIDVSTTFEASESQRKFVNRSEAAQVVGVTAATAPTAPLVGQARQRANNPGVAAQRAAEGEM